MWVIFLFPFETRSVIQAGLDLCGQSSCLNLQNTVVTTVGIQAQQFRLPLTCYFSSVLSLFALFLFIINIYKKAFSINSNMLYNLTNQKCSTFPNFDRFSNSQHLQHLETVPESAPTASVSNSSNKLKLLLCWQSLQTLVPSHVKAWHPI